MLTKFFHSFNKTKGFTLFLCCTLFILNFCYAIPLLLKPMYSEADAYGRAMVYPFTGSGIFLMDGGVWLPLYETFISASQILPVNPVMAPRLISLLAACCIPIVIFLLTKITTKHNGFSFATGVLCILFPLFREIGAVTLSETLFLALFLGALYFLLNGRYFIFGSLLALSQMTRFESWFAVPWLVILIILLKKTTVTKKSLLIGLCVFFPLLFSAISYFDHGTGVQYVNQMQAMATVGHVEGQNNFPVALSKWNEKFWQVVPISFVGLFAVGIWVLLREKETAQNNSAHQQFVFIILPVFLLLMLPIQLFLPFRDWLPTRYILIPATLLFPLIGKGLQFITTQWSWRTFWQWHLVVVIFLCFELYSLQLNTQALLASYNHIQFAELYQTLDFSVRKILLEEPDTRIYICNPDIFDTRVLTIDRSFVRYFLLPIPHEQIEYITATRLPEVLAHDPHKKIVISTTAQNLSGNQSLRTLFEGEYYRFSVAN